MNEKLLNRNWIVSIVTKLIVSCVIYGMLMTCQLTNKQDGTWNGFYLIAGKWELSLGRWAVKYLDYLHFGFAVNPFTSVITLLLFIIGTCFLVDVLSIKPSSIMDYLISFIFLGNIIVCDSLSYLYTSNTYGMAFFLSMLCVKLIVTATNCNETSRRKSILFAMLGSICICIVLGLYQAYLGCITTVCVIYIIKLFFDHKEKLVKKFSSIASGTGIWGSVFYYLVLQIELKRYDVQLSSYNGANSVSISNIVTNLIRMMKRAYTEFGDYYLGKSFRWNVLVTQTSHLNKCLCTLKIQ